MFEIIYILNDVSFDRFYLIRYDFLLKENAAFHVE